MFSESLNKSSTAFLFHIPIDGGTRNSPQDGDLRSSGFIDDDDQTETHGDQDAHQNAQEQGAQEGGHLAVFGIFW